MQSIKASLGHTLTKSHTNIGAKGLVVNIYSMFFENSLKIEQQIHIYLHLIFFHLSCLGNGIGRRWGLFLNVDNSREFL
jgi:hypothetical protein